MNWPRHLGRAARRGVIAFAALVACASAAGALAPGASANKDQWTMIMDDNVFLYGSSFRREFALGQMREFGVDAIRVTVLWDVIAHDARVTPELARRFNGANPASYPQHNWDQLDSLMRSAQRHGIAVLLNVTYPGPPWAHHRSPDPAIAHSYKPRLSEWAKFVFAVGLRYSGAYRDENQGGDVLPRANFWSIGNEPTQGHTLTPQWEYNRIARDVIPTAPIIYRHLYILATISLAVTGHANDAILAGETSPLGKDERGPTEQLRPHHFIRELFCLDARGRPYTGRAARARRCDVLERYGGLRMSGWAHHPYTQTNPPWRRDPHPDSINMANISTLTRALDYAALRTGAIPPGLPVFLTENGWQTWPEPIERVSFEQQSEYINTADFIAYRNPRVWATTQFLLRDVGPRTEYGHPLLRWFTWQSGLQFENAVPKPAMFAWLMGLMVRPATPAADGSARVYVWGQVRFKQPGVPEYVFLQWRPQGSNAWRTVGDPVVVVNPQGFYQTLHPSPGPGVWRSVRFGLFPRVLVSREVLQNR